MRVRKKLLIGVLVLSLGAFFAFKEGDKYFEIAKNLDIFASLFRELNTYYVDDIKPDKIMTTGIEAMLESLDPYTDYIPEDNLDDLKFQTTGKYAGVGASIRKMGDWTVITEVYEGSPMEKAGVKAGDIIVSLDGKPAKGLPQEEVSRLLKGKPFTPLQIVVSNPITRQENSLTIVRNEINLKTVSYAGMVTPQIGYIRMQQFTEFSGSQVQSAFEELKKAHPGIKGLILDLRGNPGGILDEAVRVANIFLDKGQTVVSTKGRVKNWDREYKTPSPAVDANIPISVLTNRMSASAAEIVAGAIQDLDRGLIVGQRSFGKGLVQTTRSLPYNAKLKVTTAKYYTPSGRCIQAIDYSHRNEEGEADYVPDSLKRSFQTAHGRLVRDGGGIEPDVKVAPSYLSNISIALLNKNHIFNYATQYYYAHPKAPDARSFRLSEEDFDQFLQYLEGKDYDYKTRSEDALEAFKNTARKEKYYDAISTEFENLKNKMGHDKKQDLLKNKEEIKHLLEEEIMSRYYLQKGRIEKSFDWDKEIHAAVQVLTDTRQYQELLKGKG